MLPCATSALVKEQEDSGVRRLASCRVARHANARRRPLTRCAFAAVFPRWRRRAQSALQYPRPLEGVVALSCWLANPRVLAERCRARLASSCRRTDQRTRLSPLLGQGSPRLRSDCERRVPVDTRRRTPGRDPSGLGVRCDALRCATTRRAARARCAALRRDATRRAATRRRDDMQRTPAFHLTLTTPTAQLAKWLGPRVSADAAAAFLCAGVPSKLTKRGGQSRLRQHRRLRRGDRRLDDTATTWRARSRRLCGGLRLSTVWGREGGTTATARQGREATNPPCAGTCRGRYRPTPVSRVR